MFRRRRRMQGQDAAAEEDIADADPDTGHRETVSGGDLGVPEDRPNGPWDETDPAPEVPRLDLGAVRVPATPEFEVELNVQADEIVAVTVTYQGGAVQLQAFAAPKSGGLWDEARHEIADELTSSGSHVDEVEGPFGTELRTELPGEPSEAGNAGQSARFVGVEGPRWLLRGVFAGSAGLDSGQAQPLERVFRGTVVVRGDGPMPPRERLPLQLPEELDHQADTEESGGAERQRNGQAE